MVSPVCFEPDMLYYTQYKSARVSVTYPWPHVKVESTLFAVLATRSRLNPARRKGVEERGKNGFEEDRIAPPRMKPAKHTLPATERRRSREWVERVVCVSWLMRGSKRGWAMTKWLCGVPRARGGARFGEESRRSVMCRKRASPR